MKDFIEDKIKHSSGIKKQKAVSDKEDFKHQQKDSITVEKGRKDFCGRH